MYYRMRHFYDNIKQGGENTQVAKHIVAVNFIGVISSPHTPKCMNQTTQ